MVPGRVLRGGGRHGVAVGVAQRHGGAGRGSALRVGGGGDLEPERQLVGFAPHYYAGREITYLNEYN